jgi:5-methylcytosine-specific restriction endonuclease McrA
MRNNETGQFEVSDDAPWRDESILYELYSVQGLSAADAGDQLGTSATTIRRWLRNHDISVRSPGPGSGGSATELHDEETLRSLYVEDGLGVLKIAQKLECHRSTVQYWLQQYDIERRPGHEEESPDELNSPDTLREMHLKEGMSSYDIAEEIGASQRAVWERLDRYGISRGRLTGEDHPRWAGGISQNYGPKWPKRRRQALNRDGWECQRCGLANEAHRSEYECNLHVHHIRPFRTFDSKSEAHELDNLLTLCAECHRRLEGLPIDTR